jgi:hypothetical protein
MSKLNPYDWRCIRDRLELLAHERGIPRSQIPHARHTQLLVKFCRRHRVNLDWLFLGSLRDLQLQTDWAKGWPLTW